MPDISVNDTVENLMIDIQVKKQTVIRLQQDIEQVCCIYTYL